MRVEGRSQVGVGIVWLEGVTVAVACRVRRGRQGVGVSVEALHPSDFSARDASLREMILPRRPGRRTCISPPLLPF
jgi:hypothetical protein